MTKKFVVLTALITVAVLFLIFFSFAWAMNRQNLVLAGLAKPFFPYFKYSQEELNKLYPQYINVDVATTRSPEETHKKFVEKLKAGDLNGAVECCFVRGKWEAQKQFFQGVKDKKLWDVMMRDLDTKIQQNLLLDTMATYSYTGVSDGGKYGHTISFIKNSQGVWLIESL
ncbi:MAG: hypothetical protein A2921_00070 [Candidatus Magasanikbacteria bacterium RIFCSPLOWO2_01_FULL_43_20b]|uniref:Uncharacterized protein n=1 Tax=Candidatus Magasanikbacteria bacterium RIFCSPLOWO2_12_FULL_43_12 TaxID=1798692 RepID=A0A1F6MTM4_9BACT|nr:MAG: hypothetical protein A3C74_00955 [Candidatus Magasanikbacteria bacterium RIFCSPHIGHO2_02_FULL_44_13]OGH72605.1 MAG: hypothetical protein A3I93_01630 [Candidatus Magasanikbacteria bacterium RIFCSPLOWO2_02_FULL_43_22]OGH72962.1 MAG: hypothetical protein A2921_00070 [Candidatus Magasanikbacteria bacterium RIFCSPLOWO2_01_FULL_43_20b]OGH75016.1 MAG: hypothetical protein A3G00_01535 [Candidatus Magasanikbacteria bacterium RIFCSPLOWO2_12_FULL_43_12]